MTTTAVIAAAIALVAPTAAASSESEGANSSQGPAPPCSVPALRYSTLVEITLTCGKLPPELTQPR